MGDVTSKVGAWLLKGPPEHYVAVRFETRGDRVLVRSLDDGSAIAIFRPTPPAFQPTPEQPDTPS